MICTEFMTEVSYPGCGPEVLEFALILVVFVALHFAYDVWLQPWCREHFPPKKCSRWRRAFGR